MGGVRGKNDGAVKEDEFEVRKLVVKSLMIWTTFFRRW
jgi:hypothetical protein